MKSTFENSANRLVDVVREHPIPLGLIGVGVTWLLIESRRSSENGSAYPARLAGRVRGKMAEAKDVVSDVASRVSDRASDAAHRVAEVARGAGSRVGQAAGVVTDRAADLGRRTSHQVRRARAGYWDLIERQPMAAGAATLAAGLLVGLLVPSTDHENRLMGETRDELLGRAR